MNEEATRPVPRRPVARKGASPARPMKVELKIGGRKRRVELERAAAVDAPRGGGWTYWLDGRAVDADVVEVATGTYSILLEGQSYEVRVRPGVGGGFVVQTAGEEFPVDVVDPRAWRGGAGRHGSLEVEGRQQVLAPMPGKVVRVLAKAGETVEAGQGLVVVEAMKMQNEIRSPKTGRVERLDVAEGQAVNAGEVLAIVS